MTRSGQPRMRMPAGLYGRMYHQEFEVLCRYDVFFTCDLFDPDNPLLPTVFVDPGPDGLYYVGVCIDDGLVAAQPDLPDRIGAYFRAHDDRLRIVSEPAIVPGGEARKGDWAAMFDTLWHFGSATFGRQDYALAIGGGAMLDMVGFAMSLVYRGVRQVRVPSTVLGQCDTGVRVRTFVNEAGRKDFASTLAPPFAVINDLALLRSLNRREWVGGVAEVFKIAICRDAGLFDYLCDHVADIEGRDEEVMTHLIQRSAVLHLERIRDEGLDFGTGRETPIDFGHWVGHKLEAMSRFFIGHGQAVAVGVAVDSVCAHRIGLITADELDRILRGLTDAGLPIYHKHLEVTTSTGDLKLLAALRDLERRLGARFAVALPDRIGHSVPVRTIEPAVVVEAVDYLRRLA